jgi:ribosome-associated protein
MIHVAPGFEIDENDLVFEFVRASGPGGQNVNKVSSAVQLRYDVAKAALPEDVRQRLIKLAGQRMTDEGVLILDARATRSQIRNREAAVAQLVDLIRQATIRPKNRYKTRPTAASQRKRVERKTQRGKIKSLRGRVRRDDE